MPPIFTGGARLASDPLPALTAADAKAQLIAMIDRATRPILDAYPPAERLSWDAKEAEAAAVMAAETPTPADYPLLRGECAAEEEIAAGHVTVPQLTAKAEAVLWLASQWRTLVSTLSGLRKRTEVAIYSADDDAARWAALAAARLEIAAVTG